MLAPVIAPLKVVLVALPVVRAAAPPLLVAVPLPVSEPMVWLKPAISSVPGEVTVMALVDPNTLVEAPAASVPAEMTHGVAVLGAPVSVHVLVPVLLKTPKPRY